MLKFICTQRDYCIPVPLRPFMALTHREFQRPERETLYKALMKIEGVTVANYDNHFGANVFVTVETEKDSEEKQREIAQTIEKHLHPRRR